MSVVSRHSKGVVVLGVFIIVSAIMGCLPDPTKMVLESNRPIGQVQPLIDGYEIYVVDAYPLHEDYLRFKISARPPVGWDVTRNYYQIDGGELVDMREQCVTLIFHQPTDCTWENPRDGSEHTITLIAYFGMIKTKLDENNLVVRMSNGELAMDTTEHSIPTKHSFKVHCFR